MNRHRTRVFCIAAAIALASCHRDVVIGPPTQSISYESGVTLGSVTAIPGAAVIAVGGTQQIVPLLFALTGVELETYDSVTYQLNSIGDTTFVVLSSNGLVTGLRPTAAPVKVNVFVSKDGVTKGDQAFISVTQGVVKNLELSWFISSSPSGGDSTRLAFGVLKETAGEVLLFDSLTDARVPNPAVRFSVKPADALRLTVYTPSLTFGDTPISIASANAPVTPTQILANDQNGVVWLYESTTAYGRQMTDSILYTLLFPIQGEIDILATGLGLASPFKDQTSYVSSGAIVTFMNATPLVDGIAITFTFDTPAHATQPLPASLFGGQSGNITVLLGGQAATRKFLVCSVCPAETVKWTAAAVAGVAPWGGQTISGSIYIPP